MNPVNLLVWVHILCMVSVIGALLSMQLCIGPDDRNLASPSRKIARLCNILLAVGFVSIIAYYILSGGHTRGPHYNGVVGVKFVFFLAAGALIGISKTTDKGDGLRWIALGLMLLASLFGTTLN
ncbi:MAG TPA: hypothetical protein PKE26_11285 [Kiritimatiellia bacterium]|nr:hypothetical protein [Kiritimatiellia bacterium]HMO99683.1 hypothetical protein [Kiritimatiellia bacterium]